MGVPETLLLVPFPPPFLLFKQENRNMPKEGTCPSLYTWMYLCNNFYSVQQPMTEGNLQYYMLNQTKIGQPPVNWSHKVMETHHLSQKL